MCSFKSHWKIHMAHLKNWALPSPRRQPLAQAAWLARTEQEVTKCVPLHRLRSQCRISALKGVESLQVPWFLLKNCSRQQPLKLFWPNITGEGHRSSWKGLSETQQLPVKETRILSDYLKWMPSVLIHCSCFFDRQPFSVSFIPFLRLNYCKYSIKICKRINHAMVVDV